MKEDARQPKTTKNHQDNEAVPMSPEELRQIIRSNARISYSRAVIEIMPRSNLLSNASDEDRLLHGLSGALLQAEVLREETFPALSWFNLTGKNVSFLVKKHEKGCIVFGYAIRINDSLWNVRWKCVFFIFPHNKHGKWIAFNEEHGRPEFFTPGNGSNHHAIDLDSDARTGLHRDALGMIGVEVK